VNCCTGMAKSVAITVAVWWKIELIFRFVRSQDRGAKRVLGLRVRGVQIEGGIGARLAGRCIELAPEVPKFGGK
jgi:hypothetical protein